MLKDFEAFVFADTPVDEGQMREIATGGFLDTDWPQIFGDAKMTNAMLCGGA